MPTHTTTTCASLNWVRIGKTETLTRRDWTQVGRPGVARGGLPGHVPGLAALHARDSERVETYDHPLDLRIGVRSPEVALRQAVDVIVRTVEGRVVQLGQNLDPAEHVLWVHNQQGGSRIALHVAETVTFGGAIEPDQAVAVLVPDRSQLDGAVGACGRQGDWQRFVQQCAQAFPKLKRHST